MLGMKGGSGSHGQLFLEAGHQRAKGGVVHIGGDSVWVSGAACWNLFRAIFFKNINILARGDDSGCTKAGSPEDPRRAEHLIIRL